MQLARKFWAAAGVSHKVSFMSTMVNATGVLSSENDTTLGVLPCFHKVSGVRPHCTIDNNVHQSLVYACR